MTMTMTMIIIMKLADWKSSFAGSRLTRFFALWSKVICLRKE